MNSIDTRFFKNVFEAVQNTSYGGPLLGLSLPFPAKLKVLGHRQKQNASNVKASRLINYLFIGVYFIPCDCYC